LTLKQVILSKNPLLLQYSHFKQFVLSILNPSDTLCMAGRRLRAVAAQGPASLFSLLLSRSFCFSFQTCLWRFLFLHSPKHRCTSDSRNTHRCLRNYGRRCDLLVLYSSNHILLFHLGENKIPGVSRYRVASGSFHGTLRRTVLSGLLLLRSWYTIPCWGDVFFTQYAAANLLVSAISPVQFFVLRAYGTLHAYFFRTIDHDFTGM
jgi:hypothetical protein